MQTTEEEAKELNKRLANFFLTEGVSRFEDPKGILIIPDQEDYYYEDYIWQFR